LKEELVIGILLIVVIVVGCALLMVFMMRGMGGHASGSAPEMAKPKEADQVRIEQLEAGLDHDDQRLALLTDQDLRVRRIFLASAGLVWQRRF